MFKFRPKMAFLAVPAVLALGVVSYGSVVAMAAPSHPSVVKSATEPAEATTESDTGGYADPDNVQSDTQQDGIN